MITDIQTVVGAVQFSGGPSRGLVRFENSIPLPDNSLDTVPVVTNIALQGNNVATMDVDCYLERQGGLGTERLQILFDSAVTGFQKLGCRIPVPRDPTNGFLPWSLVLFTANKSVDASLIVSFEAGQAIVDDA